ncbi:MAG: hypothetical protein PHW15_00620 [Patescibacteria group bacterium]|jgi:glucan phosphoethanolaminetransferase (alkaline phosphatase superfamily)|nr:hypothetical protein [Patescibacteria group bacterium]MDD5172907.1 hypothetical protein [Patescibacteria group bacterium]
MENNQTKLYQEREKYRHRAFLMMLEIGIILALPAFAALFAGIRLDQNYKSGKFYTFSLLFLSFILSWMVIIIKYVRFNKKIKSIDKEIKELKELKEEIK